MTAIEIHANSCLSELVYGAGLVLVFMWMQP